MKAIACQRHSLRLLGGATFLWAQPLFLLDGSRIGDRRMRGLFYGFGM
jgi:hypothetical protein